MEVYQPSAAGGAASALLFAQTAESAPCDTTGAEGAFDLSTYDIPAGSLAVGDVLEVDLGVTEYATFGFPLIVYLRSLAVQLATYTENNPAPRVGHILANGTVQAIGVGGIITWQTWVTGMFGSTYGKTIDNPIDTTGIVTLHASGKWGGNNAGQDARSDRFVVKKFRV